MAASSVTVIGRTTHLRGRVSGDGDFRIEGLVVGEVTVGGDVTIEAHGMVGANVRARRLVVRGAVQGDLLGEEAIVLEEGARVVGDVRAPRVAIARGALMRGQVETAGADAPSASAGRAQVAAKASPPAARSGAVAPAPAKAAPPAQAKAAPAPKSSAVSPAAASSAGAAAVSAARRPPPPVVPVLKKAKGQMLRKKDR